MVSVGFSRLAVGGVVLVAAFLRLVHLRQQGFLYSDEVAYFNIADFSLPLINITTFLKGQVGWLNLDYAARKPMHMLTELAAIGVLGRDPFSPQFFSALFGIAGVWMIFLVGTRLFNWKVGATAALLLAFSGSHLHFSRVGLAESGGTFFYLCALYFYACDALSDTTKRGLAWLFAAVAGLCLGVSFGFHPNLLAFVLSLFAFDLVRSVADAVRTRTFRSIGLTGIVFGSFFLVLGVFQIISYDAYPYLERALSGPVGFGVAPPDLSYYLHVLLLMEGAPILALFAISPYVLLRSPRSFGTLFLAFHLVMGVGYYLVSGIGGAFLILRNLSPFLPWICLGTAYALWGVVRLYPSRVVLAAGLLALTLTRLPDAWVILNLRSGFADADDTIHQHYANHHKAYYGWGSVGHYYDWGKQILSQEDLNRWQAMEPTAPHLLVAHDLSPEWNLGPFGAAASRWKLVAAFPNPYEHHIAGQLENGGSVSQSQRTAQERLGQLRLYEWK